MSRNKIYFTVMSYADDLSTINYGSNCRAQQMTLVGGGIAIIIAMLSVLSHHYMVALAFMLLGKIFIQVSLLQLVSSLSTNVLVL